MNDELLVVLNLIHTGAVSFLWTYTGELIRKTETLKDLGELVEKEMDEKIEKIIAELFKDDVQ